MISLRYGTLSTHLGGPEQVQQLPAGGAGGLPPRAVVTPRVARSLPLPLSLAPLLQRAHCHKAVEHRTQPVVAWGKQGKRGIGVTRRGFGRGRGLMAVEAQGMRVRRWGQRAVGQAEAVRPTRSGGVTSTPGMTSGSAQKSVQSSQRCELTLCLALHREQSACAATRVKVHAHHPP